MSRHHILLDACVAAAFFAPKTTSSERLRERSMRLLEPRAETGDLRFLIPNFCIAEVFAVFEKYRWGQTWNKHVSPQNSFTPKEFKAVRKNFQEAIHNGSRILQVELNRYHILCVDLVSPVNNRYKIKRDRATRTNARPAQTYDMLIVAMALWLKNQHHDDNLTLVTGDERLSLVVERAKSENLAKPMQRHLSAVAESVGLSYNPSLYPEVVDLVKATKKRLLARFPGVAW